MGGNGGWQPLLVGVEVRPKPLLTIAQPRGIIEGERGREREIRRPSRSSRYNVTLTRAFLVIYLLFFCQIFTYPFTIVRQNKKAFLPIWNRSTSTPLRNGEPHNLRCKKGCHLNSWREHSLHCSLHACLQLQPTNLGEICNASRTFNLGYIYSELFRSFKTYQFTSKKKNINLLNYTRRMS